MTEPSLLREVRGGVMTLRLNRPAKLNAIDRELASSLLDALLYADRDDAVRVVVLRGNGRAFCAGRDVNEAPTPDDLQGVQQVAGAMVRCSKPIIAAVHGWVVGAGLEWMLDADIVVAARNARFKLPELALGVFVTGGITAVLPRIAGLSRAKALILLGDEFSAAQAHAWGLVWSLVDDDGIDAETARLAERLGSIQPGLVGRHKQVLHQVGLAAFDQAIDLESAMQRQLMKRD